MIPSRYYIGDALEAVRKGHPRWDQIDAALAKARGEN